MDSPESGNGARAYPSNAVQLLNRIQRARTVWEEEIARYSEEQLTTLQDEGGWTAKDHIAHVAVWERGLAHLLRHEPRHKAMGLDEQTWRTAAHPDGYNAVIHRQHKDRPLEEVLLFSRHAHDEMLASLKALAYDDLFKTYTDYQPDEPGEDSGTPIIAWILETYEEHYPEHLKFIQEILDRQI